MFAKMNINAKMNIFDSTLPMAYLFDPVLYKNRAGDSHLLKCQFSARFAGCPKIAEIQTYISTFPTMVP